MGCPQVGEGVILLVEDRVVGVHHVVGAGVAVPVHPHAEGRVGEDVVGHAPDEAGVEFQSLLLEHGGEPGHVQPDGDRAAAGQDVAVIMKMLRRGQVVRSMGVNIG